MTVTRDGGAQHAVFSRYAPLAALALLVVGCASLGPSIGGPENFAAGSRFGRDLNGRDIAALATVFVDAVENGASGEPKVWFSGDYSGSVTPGDYLVGNLKPNPATLLPLEGRIDLGETYETERGLYALTGKANLRAGPSLKSRVLTQLESGTAVDVVGKVIDKPWMLVAIDGVIRGYVHQSLMIKAPGTELELAGGPARKAHFCRAFEQTLTYFGDTDRWRGVACKRGDGWRLEPVPPALVN